MKQESKNIVAAILSGLVVGSAIGFFVALKLVVYLLEKQGL